MIMVECPKSTRLVKETTPRSVEIISRVADEGCVGIKLPNER
jgi:hypothetical protein